jgi:predicted acylesterase/phospholipase RssA
MWATDIQTSNPVEFSTHKTPTYPVVSALRASMSLPIVFTPIRDLRTNNLLVDGGCMGNYPIKYLTEFEKESSLGISFINNNPKVNVDIDSILTYFQKLASLYYNTEDKNNILEYSRKTILSPCGDYPSWNFEASLEDRIRLFNIGYKAANDFLSNTPTDSTNVYKGMRRRSVS